jgi:hypothetical protein
MDQLLTRISPKKTTENFMIKLSITRNGYVKLVFRKIKKEGFEIETAVYKASNALIRYRSGMSQLAIIRANPFIKQYHRDMKNYYSTLRRRIKTKKILKEDEIKIRLERDRCFLNVIFERGDTSHELPLSPKDLVERDILHIIHISALRGNPKRVYPKTSIEERFPGTFEPYVASIIYQWSKNQPEKIAELNNFMKQLNLVDAVSINLVSDTAVEVIVPQSAVIDSPKYGSWFNIADVGFGISQTLPILVALLVAKPGQIVYIEQPEIHLHPSAQLELGNIITRAAKNGIRVIIETHSDYLITGIQTEVAKGNIDPKNVIFHWFSKNRSGVTSIKSTTLLEDGTYKKNWPEDLSNAYLHAQSQFLDESEKKFFKNA